jgi:hypothetical protein
MQLGFIEFVVEPLVKPLSDLLPSAWQGRYKQMVKNKAKWKEIKENEEGDNKI